MFYYLPSSEVLKWYRVLYTVIFTVASRWVFVLSDVNFICWHLHNAALLSALIGMWLVTISHFFSTPNMFYNTIANDFFMTSLPATGLFGLVFAVLYVPGALSDSDLEFLTIFDSTLTVALAIDWAINSIVYDMNELSIIPPAL